MNADNALYREFLEELHDLAKFRQNYALDSPDAMLNNMEDPDVKRIIEALAFFSARTHRAGLQHLEATHRRLHQQFFPFLMSSLSSMAIIKAKPTGHLTEAVLLPAGTEFSLQPEKAGLVIFRSTRSLRILPIELNSVKQEALPDKGIRLLLSFQADYPLNEQPETLNLHINYMNDFSLSLKVLSFLKHSLKNVSVQFNDYDSDKPLVACPFNLGLPPADIASDEWQHPLERERYFFHFPQQELYLELHLPVAPRNWKSFTVLLDCDQSLPGKLRLTPDLFQLFTVPIINNQRALAEPVICDGTQDRYTIRHPKSEFGFNLQTVLGVYEVSDKGMLPVRPGILAGGNGSYEIEEASVQENTNQLCWIIPHFPAAFEQPRTLVIEALWQQPWYNNYLQKFYTLQLYRRQIPGIKWELLNTPVAHATNQQLNNVAQHIHLLTLMHKPYFSIQNIRDLLNVLGSVTSSRFQPALDALIDVRIEEEPLGKQDERVSLQIYYLRFKQQQEEMTELIEIFVQHVGQVLDSWQSDALIEARWEIEDETTTATLGEK